VPADCHYEVSQNNPTTCKLSLDRGDTYRVEMSSSSTSHAAPKSDCPGFEPQQWRRSVCKNCFRSAERHGYGSSLSGPETEVATSADEDDKTTEHGTDIVIIVIIIIIIIINNKNNNNNNIASFYQYNNIVSVPLTNINKNDDVVVDDDDADDGDAECCKQRWVLNVTNLRRLSKLTAVVTVNVAWPEYRKI